MLTQKADLVFGTGLEESLKPSLEKIAGCPLTRLGGYSIFDYVNESGTVFVELKSRRIKHNDYQTAIVGLNKVRVACEDSSKAYYFCFNYTDGLYYIKFDKQLFDTFESNNNFWRSSRSDCVNYSQRIVNIPLNKLMRL